MGGVFFLTFCNSCWTLEKLPVAKMTSCVVDNMPEPVVIVKELGKGKGKMAKGKVTISPKAKKKDYGKGEDYLLKKYST